MSGLARKVGLAILGASAFIGFSTMSGVATAAPLSPGLHAAAPGSLITDARWKGGREWGRSHNRGRHLGWGRGKHRGWR